MRFVFMMALAALTAQAGSRAGDTPLKIDQATMSKVTDGVDGTFQQLWPEYPAESVGVAHIVYIRGYGVVLSGKLNLAPGLSVTPFHQEITKDNIAKTKSKKIERMPKLRDAMQDLLVKSAAQLKDLPDTEVVVLGVSLFYWRWEDRKDLPDQIVMHATKKALLAAGQDRAALKAAVQLDEF
jgi:hypothetical protein